MGSYQKGSPWSHHRGIYNNNTGLSPHRGPQQANVAWKFYLGAPILSSPAIDANGNLYIGSQNSDMYALTSSGSLLWYFQTGYSISTNFAGIVSSPAIAADGTIYVGAGDGSLYKIEPSQDNYLQYSTDGGVSASPTIGANGNIYVGSEDGCMYNFQNYEGALEVVWAACTYYVPSEFSSPVSYSSVAFSPSGAVLYFGSQDSYLFAVEASSGSLVWGYPTGDTILSSPAVGSDGTVYVGSFDNCTYAIWPSGSLKWKFRTGGNVVASPAIGADGTVYIGSQDHNFYALHPATGSVVWLYGMGGQIQSSAAIDSQGILYVGSENDYLYALTSTGSVKWTLDTGGMTVSSPVIGADGTLYVGSDEYYLYALADAPSTAPTKLPTKTPMRHPSATPTRLPSLLPTRPTGRPSIAPSAGPTVAPSAGPTVAPSADPSTQPSIFPSFQPSVDPSAAPTPTPSLEPLLSLEPTVEASSAPSVSMEPTLKTAGNADKGSPFSSLPAGTQAGVIIAILIALAIVAALTGYVIFKQRRRQHTALGKWIQSGGDQQDILVMRENGVKSGFYVLSPAQEDRQSSSSSMSSVFKSVSNSMPLHQSPQFEESSGGWRHSVDSYTEGHARI